MLTWSWQTKFIPVFYCSQRASTKSLEVLQLAPRPHYDSPDSRTVRSFRRQAGLKKVHHGGNSWLSVRKQRQKWELLYFSLFVLGCQSVFKRNSSSLSFLLDILATTGRWTTWEPSKLCTTSTVWLKEKTAVVRVESDVLWLVIAVYNKRLMG